VTCMSIISININSYCTDWYVTWASNCTDATAITMTSPNAVVNSHAAWTTDFIESGAYNEHEDLNDRMYLFKSLQQT